MVAKKLIKGHIIQTVEQIIAVSTKTGLYSLGETVFKANLLDKGPPTNTSDKKAKTNSIGINIKANL